MDKEELKKVFDEKGMDWLIAAMVDGSIGYHSPTHAKRLIESALAGETKDWCERCTACFDNDLLQMIGCDVRRMQYIEQGNPAKFNRVMEAVRQISGLTQEQQGTVGLLYPTMRI
jgi:hypothetical protein